MEGNSRHPDPAAVDSSSGGGDWRQELLTEARQHIVNKIVDILKRQYAHSSDDLCEIKKIAVRSEEKIYEAATDQSDYLRKTSLKILSMEMKTQNAAALNPSLLDPAIGIPRPSESASMDLTTQTGHASTGDWQEEIYEKVKSMKELYFTDITELHQKISLKIQQFPQNEALGPPAKQSEQFDKLKQFKQMLERTIMFLQINKSNIQANLREKLPIYEKQIMSFVASNRSKKVAPLQQQGQPQFQQAHSMSQQQPSQVAHLQQHDSLLGSKILDQPLRDHSHEQQEQLKPMQTIQAQQLLRMQQMQQEQQLQQMQIQAQQLLQMQQKQQMLHQSLMQQQMHQQNQQQNLLTQLCRQNYPWGQNHNYCQLQNPGTLFPISSLQNLQTSPSQISQSSTLIGQCNLSSSHPTTGMPSLSANSAFGIAPSPNPGDTEKQSGTSVKPRNVPQPQTIQGENVAAFKIRVAALQNRVTALEMRVWIVLWILVFVVFEVLFSNVMLE